MGGGLCVCVCCELSVCVWHECEAVFTFFLSRRGRRRARVDGGRLVVGKEIVVLTVTPLLAVVVDKPSALWDVSGGLAVGEALVVTPRLCECDGPTDGLSPVAMWEVG